MSLIDELYNRRAGLDFLDRMIKIAQRTNEPLTIGFVDVDKDIIECW